MVQPNMPRFVRESDTLTITADSDIWFYTGNREAPVSVTDGSGALTEVFVDPDESTMTHRTYYFDSSLNILKVGLVMATPSDPRLGEELTKIAADLDGMYGKGKWCEDPKKPDSCLDIEKITDIMRESRDEKKLRQVWEGWHTISPPMRAKYSRFVELSNQGAKELGFAPDLAAPFLTTLAYQHLRTAIVERARTEQAAFMRAT